MTRKTFFDLVSVFSILFMVVIFAVAMWLFESLSRQAAATEKVATDLKTELDNAKAQIATLTGKLNSLESRTTTLTKQLEKNDYPRKIDDLSMTLANSIESNRVPLGTMLPYFAEGDKPPHGYIWANGISEWPMEPWVPIHLRGKKTPNMNAFFLGGTDKIADIGGQWIAGKLIVPAREIRKDILDLKTEREKLGEPYAQNDLFVLQWNAGGTPPLGFSIQKNLNLPQGKDFHPWIQVLGGNANSACAYHVVRLYGVKADKAGTLALLKSLNGVRPEPFEQSRLQAIYKKWGPEFELKLANVALPGPSGVPRRSERDLLEEVLARLKGSQDTEGELAGTKLQRLASQNSGEARSNKHNARAQLALKIVDLELMRSNESDWKMRCKYEDLVSMLNSELGRIDERSPPY